MLTTKAHFEAIGRVAYEWSRLEMFAQTAIAVLAGIPQDTALIVTNPGTIRSWMETLRRLARHKECPADACEKCDKLTRLIEGELYGERNRVIHGLWSISWQEVLGDRYAQPADHQSKLLTIKKYGDKMLIEAEMSAANVSAIADRIYQAVQDLQWLTVVLANALRDKQP